MNKPYYPEVSPASDRGPDRIHERRRWVRFILPDVVTRLSWKEGDRTESHLVSLVNISGEGAALMMDFHPQWDRAYLLKVDHGQPRPTTIPARLVSAEETGNGRTLASFKFDTSDSTIGLVPEQRERRAWQRHVPREKAAVLSWVSGNSTVSKGVELSDIGGGGAAVLSKERPPTNEPLWLWVGREGSEVGPVECRLVGVCSAADNLHTIRLAFIGLCPILVFEVAMGLQGGVLDHLP
ncbi:hypothetical protein [Aquisphaera insulae]|uniref:hypothetical protein n=1 Tax=Aquisphaera insulae TaxID=2712864 RepID=UPI0013EC7F2A|nr:hypothetical protein [Aquisphaera insulae]